MHVLEMTQFVALNLETGLVADEWPQPSVNTSGSAKRRSWTALPWALLDRNHST